MAALERGSSRAARTDPMGLQEHRDALRAAEERVESLKVSL